jgi:hypothetical protein
MTLDPIPRLERIPGWWLGAASVRRTAADEASAAGFEKHADEQRRIASAYERRASECEGRAR